MYLLESVVVLSDLNICSAIYNIYISYTSVGPYNKINVKTVAYTHDNGDMQ